MRSREGEWKAVRLGPAPGSAERFSRGVFPPVRNHRRHDSDFTIEPVQPSDLSEVLAIERGSFVAPWSRAAFEAELEKPYAVSAWLGPAPGEGRCGYRLHLLLAGGGRDSGGKCGRPSGLAATRNRQAAHALRSRARPRGRGERGGARGAEVQRGGSCPLRRAGLPRGEGAAGILSRVQGTGAGLEMHLDKRWCDL